MQYAAASAWLCVETNLLFPLVLDYKSSRLRVAVC